VKESAGVNIGFAVADFLTQVVLVIVGVVLVLDPDLLVRQVDFGTTPTVGDFLIAIPVAMVAYTGIETISNMAEEARDYGRTIPRGIALVVGAVAVIYTFLPAVALSAMPVKNGETVLALPKEEGGYADDPVLGVVENMNLGSLQHPAEIYVGILASTILFIATNAGILGVSRLSYSMGQHRQLPEFLRLLHPRFRTPYIAIAVFSAVACVAIVPGQADFLGVIYAFGAMLSFTMAHLAVTTLRLKRPDIQRPWKGPLNIPFRGRELPGFAILGGLGTGTALIVATALDVRVLVSGVGWMILGVALYVVYRRRQGLALTETHKIVSPKPAVEHEVEYESILVAFEDSDYSPEAVSTAVRLAARRRRGIHVLVTITVPPNSPIDAAMPEQEAKASSVIDSARVRGGRRVTGHLEKVRPGQAGRRVVEEAREIRARAIVMPLPPRRAGSSIFGRTLETVLSERPARVIIDSSRGFDSSGKVDSSGNGR
jgi:APA family basic amino acid/polyamine antiporter